MAERISVDVLKFKSGVEITSFFRRIQLKKPLKNNMTFLLNDSAAGFKMLNKGAQAFKDTEGRYCLVYNTYYKHDQDGLLASIAKWTKRPYEVEHYDGSFLNGDSRIAIAIGNITIHRSLVTIVRCLYVPPARVTKKRKRE